MQDARINSQPNVTNGQSQRRLFCVPCMIKEQDKADINNGGRGLFKIPPNLEGFSVI